jgi:hypothetical protein
MDRVASQSTDHVDPRSAAAALQDDFAELVRIFDRELAKVQINAKTRPHISGAKEAAERGLELSQQLAGLLLKAE